MQNLKIAIKLFRIQDLKWQPYAQQGEEPALKTFFFQLKVKDPETKEFKIEICELERPD